MERNYSGTTACHVMAEPLVVTRQMSELEEDAGAGKTETDASESTRKFLEERVS